jgi:hypothetical protein
MAGAAVVLAAAPAFAQEQTAPTESPFARDRNISVTQRPRPGYDPLPIHAGGFDVLPQLTAGVAENDNIYAAPSGGKTSDTIFTATPELDVNSNWSRNAVQAFVRVPVDAYVSHSTEDTTDYAVGGSGRLDAGHGQISGGGDTGEYTEARTAVGVSPVSIRPIRYGLTDGFIDAQEEFNRLRVTGRVDIANYKYNNGTAPGGGLVFEEYRDRTDYTYTGKGEYAVSPDTSIYVDADYNQHRYRLTSAPLVSINENSQGEQVNIGALAKVEWFPSDLTTVTLVGSRQLEDAAITASPVYVAGIASLNVDHELLRNLILTGKAGYEDDTFKGVQRDDHRTTAYVGAKYLVNRVVGITLGYTYLDQRSMGAAQGTSYTNNIVSLSTSLKF